MNDSAPVFTVSIDGGRVDLLKIEPDRPGYKKANKKAILRQRDALELHLKLKAEGKIDGVYAFRYLDTARTFAMLHLMAVEHAIQDNIDRILNYAGVARSHEGVAKSHEGAAKAAKH